MPAQEEAGDRPKVSDSGRLSGLLSQADDGNGTTVDRSRGW